MVCPWAAARPRAVRTAWRCLWPHGCCGRRRARPPARLGVLTSFGAAPRSPPVPSGPSGALHTSGAGCAGVWLARCPEARLWLSISNFARNSSMAHSNFEFIALELQRFWGVSKNDHDKLRAKFGWRWCRCCPRVPRPGPAAHWGRVWVLQARRPGGLKPLSPFLACACVRLKPPSPLRAPAEPRLKPPSPLRVRNGWF